MKINNKQLSLSLCFAFLLVCTVLIYQFWTPISTDSVSDKIVESKPAPSPISSSLPPINDESSEPKPPTFGEVARAFEKTFNIYGIILDQNDEPVVGATVVSSGSNYRFERTADGNLLCASDWRTLSDDKGRFKLLNLSGTTFTIDNISKEGYSLAPKRDFNCFSQGVLPETINFIGQPFELPTETNPYVIRMWKSPTVNKQIPQVFQPDCSQYILSPNRYPLFVHINQNERKSELWTTQLPSPFKTADTYKEALPEPHIKFDYEEQNSGGTYSIKVIALDGGVLAVDPKTDFPFTPPRDGYQNSVSFKFNKNPNFDQGESEYEYRWVRYYFWVKSSNTHGCVHMGVKRYMDSNQNARIPLYLFFFYDPTGNRKIEYDPVLYRKLRTDKMLKRK